MDHRLEFYKLLKQHGNTLQKLAGGGPALPIPQTSANPNASLNGPTVNTGGSPSGATGMLGWADQLGGFDSNFSASGAPIQAGTNSTQLNTAYNQAQGGIGSAQSFLNALTAQNGIQNQADAYGRINNIANGNGPNPAQAMLNTNTGTNIANQAALAASTRGAGANAGLIARQAAQTGAQTQQNAVGQAAALEAEQQMSAANTAAGIAQNQVNEQGQAITGVNTAAQNEQNTLQSANSAFNNASVGMQSNLNNVNAQISQGNQSANNGFFGGVVNGVASFFGMADGGEVEGDIGDADTGGGSYTAPSSDSSPNIGSPGTSINEGTALQAMFNANGNSAGGGKGGGGGSSMMSSMGSMAALMADGGPVPAQPIVPTQPYNIQDPILLSPLASQSPTGGPKSGAGQYLAAKAPGAPNIGSMSSGKAGGDDLKKSLGNLGSALGKARDKSNTYNMTDDEADEAYLDADAAVPTQREEGATLTQNDDTGEFSGSTNASNFDDFNSFSSGGGVGSRLKAGGKVPGKPKVQGKVNTTKNDTVPALLSPGEVVLPRSVTQSQNPAEAAKRFVQALMARKQRAAA